MADSTVSSVVVIPEEPEQNKSLKRRQSSTSTSSDTNKRPRLEALPSSTVSRDGEASPTVAAPAAAFTSSTSNEQAGQSTMSPPAARRRQTSSLEQDKSRNRRLFGALLGNLSQGSQPTRRTSAGGITKPSTPSIVTSRREEIESRQRERLKRESHDVTESARQKREQVNRQRRIEQTRWDKEAIHLRHRNMRATAGFLQTKAEPKLYYKPWELRDLEEDEIKRQKADVEAKIAIEADQSDEKTKEVRRQEQNGGQRQKDNTDQPMSSADPEITQNGAMAVDGIPENEKASSEKDTPNGFVPNESDDNQAKTNGNQPQEAEKVGASSAEDHFAEQAESTGLATSSKGDEHDHGGEELELGQEDDVIY